MSDTHGAGAPPAAAPASNAPAPAASETPSGPSAAEVLAFDPFAPPSTPATDAGNTPAPSATPGDASTGEGGAKPGQTPPPAVPGQTPPSPTPPTPASPPVATPNLEQLLRDQTEAIRQAVQPQQTPAAAQPEAPRFNLGVPPQILDGMASEDPKERATSVHALVNGIANHVWNAVQQHLETAYTPHIMQRVQGHQQSAQTAEQVKTDFYGTHKNLDNELIRPMVQQAGMVVAQERLRAGKPVTWSAEMRDEIADRIYTVMPHLKPAAAAAAPGGNPPAQPRVPFAAGGGGPRPAPAPANDQFGADLLT